MGYILKEDVIELVMSAARNADANKGNEPLDLKPYSTMLCNIVNYSPRK